jgi:tetratricopeptide (TPR) repeat protein
MARTGAPKAFDDGNARMSAGAYDEAVALYDQAIAEKSDHVFAFFNRGQALKKLQRLDEAAYSFAHAIAFRPPQAALYEIFGGFLCDLERPEAAINILRQGLAFDPASVKILILLTKALTSLQRYDEALIHGQAAADLKPDDAEVSSLLGGALFSLHRYAESVAALETAVALSPGRFKAHFNLALALTMAGFTQRALEEFEKALALEPGHKKSRLNIAICQLKLGNFETGWRGYQHRRDYNTHHDKIGFDRPEWLGAESLVGKTVLVHAEFGLGDTIQFCRYIPLMERAGAKVLFAPQPKIRALMASLSDTVEIVEADDPGLAFDYHCRVMSLPLAFGTTLATIPAASPYLTAEPARVGRWRRILGETGFKVGVCWRGSRIGDEKGLSFAPADLAGLATIPGVRLVSLQKSDAPEERKALSEDTAIEILLDPADLSEEAMLDTAALISACDLVISCDTSIAHLAGALGRPTWVVMPVDGDWRWLDRRADSPWYPSMRLFRPTLLGSRQAVFEAVETELSQLARSR